MSMNGPNTYPDQRYLQNGGYPVLPEHPQGTVILVLGILGLVSSGICGVIAWILGRNAEKEIAASGVHYSNEQNIRIGKILGMVTTLFAIVALAIVIVVMIVSFGLFAAAAHQIR